MINASRSNRSLGITLQFCTGSPTTSISQCHLQHPPTDVLRSWAPARRASIFCSFKGKPSSAGSSRVSPNCNIRLRHHGHTRMPFDMPGSATQGRGKGTRPACISFSEQGVQGRGKRCGRGRPTLSDGAGTGQTAMNQEPVG